MSPSHLPSCKILLTGMGGVLGIGLARSLALPGVEASFAHAVSPSPDLDDLLVAGRTQPGAWAKADFARLDLAIPGQFFKLIEEVQPDAILHAAAMARPAECESNPQAAWRVNCEAVSEGAQAAKRIGARLVFCSTDQVFDGLADRYAEDDKRNPLQVYGATKVAAEDAVLDAGGTVIRLPLLLGPEAAPGHMGADQALLNATEQGKSIGLFVDEIRAPADAALLAATIWKLLLAVDLPTVALQPRIHHLAGSQAVSRYELGERVCQTAQITFNHGSSTLKEWIGLPRPARLVLTCQRAQRELGFVPPDLRQSLARLEELALD